MTDEEKWDALYGRAAIDAGIPRPDFKGVERAVLAEREACAKIADERAQWAETTTDQIGNGSPDAYTQHLVSAELIAEEIRARGGGNEQNHTERMVLAEREACAQIAHQHGQSWDKAESSMGFEPWAIAAEVIEDAIRARGGGDEQGDTGDKVLAEREACAQILDLMARDAGARAETSSAKETWLLIAREDNKMAAEIRARGRG